MAIGSDRPRILATIEAKIRAFILESALGNSNPIERLPELANEILDLLPPNDGDDWFGATDARLRLENVEAANHGQHETPLLLEEPEVIDVDDMDVLEEIVRNPVPQDKPTLKRKREEEVAERPRKGRPPRKHLSIYRNRDGLTKQQATRHGLRGLTPQSIAQSRRAEVGEEARRKKEEAEKEKADREAKEKADKDKADKPRTKSKRSTQGNGDNTDQANHEETLGGLDLVDRPLQDIEPVDIDQLSDDTPRGKRFAAHLNISLTLDWRHRHL